MILILQQFDEKRKTEENSCKRDLHLDEWSGKMTIPLTTPRETKLLLEVAYLFKLNNYRHACVVESNALTTQADTK